MPRSTCAPRPCAAIGTSRAVSLTAIGAIPLKDLRPAHLQALYGELLASGLAAQTVVLHHRCLKLALKHAVQWELVHRNVAEAVKPPRPTPRPMRVLDANAFERLLAIALIDLQDPIYVAVQTGLRQGEQLALRWSDIDLGQGTLLVERTVQCISGTGLVYGEPKSTSSRRTIDLSDATVAVLRRLHRDQLERRLQLGPSYSDANLVSGDALGEPINPHRLSTRFRRFVAKTEFAGLRWHDLRHTSATLLLQQGAHTKAVSERLGHANVAVTLQVYAHVLPSIARETAQMLDAVLALPETRTG